MKVKDAIAMLSRMNPEERIIIEWWDKSCFTHGTMLEEPYEHCWNEVVDEWEDMVEKDSNTMSGEIWDWVHDGLIEKGAYND